MPFTFHLKFNFSSHSQCQSYLIMVSKYLWVSFRCSVLLHFLSLCWSHTSWKTYVFFILEYNCFIILCNFLLYNEVSQLCVHTYPLPLEPPSHPSPAHPSRLSQSTELSFLCYAAASHYQSVSCGVVNICQCHSPSLSHPPLLHLVSARLFLCLCFYSCSPNRFVWTIFLDFIYMCTIWYLFFSFWLIHSVWQTLGPSMSLQMTRHWLYFGIQNYCIIWDMDKY